MFRISYEIYVYRVHRFYIRTHREAKKAHEYRSPVPLEIGRVYASLPGLSGPHRVEACIQILDAGRGSTTVLTGKGGRDGERK